MADCSDLEEEARRSAANFDFGDLLELADCWGFRLKRTRGSHYILTQEVYPQPSRQEIRKKFGFMNFQEDDGQAKPYQVKQLLKAIDYYRENFEE